MNFPRQDFRKLSSCRQTERQVTRGHFPSRDNNDGHRILSAVVQNPMLHANLMDLSFIEPKLWVTEVYIAGIGIMDVLGSCDLDPMIFI